MRLVVICLLALILPACAGKSPAPDYGGAICDVVDVYDGDTFYCDIAGYPDIVGKRVSIRIRGIDTPEMRAESKKTRKRAQKAKEFTADALAGARKVELVNIERDKYFRILADVYVDDKNLGKLLLKKRLAVPYDGGTKDK